MITEHRVTHPEIAVNGDEATGTWYLQDRVIVAEFDFMLIGAGFYHDRYRRTADGWRISGDWIRPDLRRHNVVEEPGLQGDAGQRAGPLVRTVGATTS